MGMMLGQAQSAISGCSCRIDENQIVVIGQRHVIVHGQVTSNSTAVICDLSTDKQTWFLPTSYRNWPILSRYFERSNMLVFVMNSCLVKFIDLDDPTLEVKWSCWPACFANGREACMTQIRNWLVYQTQVGKLIALDLSTKPRPKSTPVLIEIDCEMKNNTLMMSANKRGQLLLLTETTAAVYNFTAKNSGKWNTKHKALLQLSSSKLNSKAVITDSLVYILVGQVLAAYTLKLKRYSHVDPMIVDTCTPLFGISSITTRSVELVVLHTEAMILFYGLKHRRFSLVGQATIEGERAIVEDCLFIAERSTLVAVGSDFICQVFKLTL